MNGIAAFNALLQYLNESKDSLATIFGITRDLLSKCRNIPRSLFFIKSSSGYLIPNKTQDVSTT